MKQEGSLWVLPGTGCLEVTNILSHYCGSHQDCFQGRVCPYIQAIQEFLLIAVEFQICTEITDDATFKSNLIFDIFPSFFKSDLLT